MLVSLFDNLVRNVYFWGICSIFCSNSLKHQAGPRGGPFPIRCCICLTITWAHVCCKGFFCLSVKTRMISHLSEPLSTHSQVSSEEALLHVLHFRKMMKLCMPGLPLEMSGQQFLLLFFLFVIPELTEIISENLPSLIVASCLLLSKHSHG